MASNSIRKYIVLFAVSCLMSTRSTVFNTARERVKEATISATNFARCIDPVSGIDSRSLKWSQRQNCGGMENIYDINVKRNKNCCNKIRSNRKLISNLDSAFLIKINPSMVLTSVGGERGQDSKTIPLRKIPWRIKNMTQLKILPEHKGTSSKF